MSHAWWLVLLYCWKLLYFVCKCVLQNKTKNPYWWSYNVSSSIHGRCIPEIYIYLNLTFCKLHHALINTYYYAINKQINKYIQTISISIIYYFLTVNSARTDSNSFFSNVNWSISWFFFAIWICNDSTSFL